jgi:hypothetical protein
MRITLGIEPDYNVQEHGILTLPAVMSGKAKPILRPILNLWLSENERDRNKLTEWDLEYIENSLNIWNYYEIQSLVEDVSYEHVQYLLSRHYDIFNLIMENLAIDIKTLYQN